MGGCYLREVIQDIDGYYSFKRLAVFILLMLLAVAVFGATIFGVMFPDSIVTNLVEGVKWGIGFVAAEHLSKMTPGSAPVVPKEEVK